MPSIISEHIETTPGVCGGRPRIAGHRIRVSDIVIWHERQGLSPEEIVTRFPQLSLSDVFAALTYYHDHREEIHRSIREDEEFADSLRLKTPSKLLQKMTGQESAQDAVSS